MKNFAGTFIAVLLVLAFASCNDENLEMDETNMIEFGSECGWCAGMEYIKVTEQKIRYTRTIPCGENKGTRTESRKINEAEWQELQNTFDFEQFQLLDYNECNVCVDGCDEILRITSVGETHEIRYNPESEIAAISGLQTKLRELMLEFSNEN